MLAGEVDPKSSMQRVSSESRDLISWARLLERRVSFAPWAAAEPCAVLSVEPKNLIKLFATDAAGKDWASGSCAHRSVSRRRSGQELLAVARIDFHSHRGGAARSRRARYRGCGGSRCRLGPVRLRHVLLNINFALEVGPLFNGNPLSNDVAHGDG